MLATDAKTQKIEPDPKKNLWWAKVSEAACKRDWQCEVVFIFQRAKISDENFRLSVQWPWLLTRFHVNKIYNLTYSKLIVDL